MISKSFSAWVVQHPAASLLLPLFLAIALSLGGVNAEFSANQRDFLKPTDPQLNKLISLENNYTSDENIMVLLEPKSGKVFEPSTLNAVRELTEFGWQMPYSQRVESITNHVYTQVHEDDLITENLIEDETQLTPDQLEQRRHYAINKPGVVGYLVNEDASLTLINVTLILPAEKNGEAAVEVVHVLREFVQTMQSQFPNIEFRISGGVAIQVALPEVVEADMGIIFPITLMIVFLFLVLVLRDISANIACVATCLLAILAGMGSVLAMGVKITPVLMNTPPIIIILAMADCIHIVVNYAQNLSKGMEKTAALKKSIEINFTPVIFTSITTAISFFALNFSESPPFAQMGNAAGIGILFAMVASLTFLPAALHYLPAKASGVAALPSAGKLLDYYKPHVNKILIGFGILITILASLIPLNRLEDNFVEFFDESLEVRQNIDYLTQHISGSIALNISVPALTGRSIYDPEYLYFLEEFEQKLKQSPQLEFVVSLPEVMKTLNRQMNQDDPAYYKIPESSELAAQYLLLYEMSLPYGQDLNNLIRFDRSASRVLAVYNQMSDKELIELENELQSWLDSHTFLNETAVIGSSNLAFAHMQYTNVNNLSKGFVVALIAISILLIFMFRSFALGSISIIPNLFPAAMAFGIWALISGKVGFGMSVGITLTLGIVVDDTIHLLAKFKYAKEQLGLNNEDSIRYALDTVGVAMLLTTAMMVISFTAILFSDFTPNQDLGLITIITIVCALLIDLVLLPVVLLKVFQGSDESGATPTVNLSPQASAKFNS